MNTATGTETIPNQHPNTIETTVHAAPPVHQSQTVGMPAGAQTPQPAIPGMLGSMPDFAVPSGLLKPAPIAPIQPDIVDLIVAALSSGYATDVRGASLIKDVYAAALHIYQQRDEHLRKLGIGLHEVDLYDHFALSIISGAAARGPVVASEVWLTAAQYVDARRKRGF